MPRYKMWFNIPDESNGKTSRVWAFIPKGLPLGRTLCDEGFWMGEDGDINPVARKSRVYVPGHQIICIVDTEAQ